MRRLLGGIVLLFLLVWERPLAAEAVYQYAAPVADRTAYLWLPPQCDRVRGLVMALANLTERRWLEDPIMRAAMADECLGVVWIGPGDETLLNADLKPGSGELLQRLFRDLAGVSGHPELELAPVIPMGHSAHGHFAWRFAELFPERTIAAIPIKTVPLPASLRIAGIPLLYVVGESTEWPQYRDGRPGDRDFFWPRVQQSARRLRHDQQENLMAVATEPGGGHFDWTEAQARLVALFIHKACAYRLPLQTPAAGPILLRPVHEADGWLIDSAGLQPDRWPPAAAGSFQGPEDQSYWLFDREMAEAVTRFAGDRKPRKMQMLTFRQDGHLLPVAKEGFAPLNLETDADGITFHLRPDFLPQIPPELIGAGTPLGHANGPIHLQILTGPAEQLGPQTFRIALQRGLTAGDAWNDLWIEESQDGDAVYRRAAQPGKMRIPERLTEGATQTIIFAPLPNRKATAKALALRATASSGLSVHFYVDYGPAVVEGSRLVFRDVPKHLTQPIKIRVVAYQWGRSASAQGKDEVQSAEPVAQTLTLLP